MSETHDGTQLKRPGHLQGSRAETDAALRSSDIYIISCIVVGSIVIFATGGIPYVDALFFASGATTQSGLNT